MYMRYHACLQNLSHEDLLQIAASGMRECRATRILGDAMLASKLPEQLAAAVLLSQDLIAPVLSSLPLTDLRTARVCHLWRDAWHEKMLLPLGQLRHLRSVGEFGYATQVVAMPGREAVLVPNYEQHRLDVLCSQPAAFEEQLCAPDIDDGEVVETLRTPSAVALMADGLAWVVESDRYSVVKVDLEEKLRLHEIERSQLGDGAFPEDVAIADDALLVLSRRNGETTDHCVSVFSASTGEFQHSFGGWGKGRSELFLPTSMAVHGESVYVADRGNHRVQVFRHADGMHVRSIGLDAAVTEELWEDMLDWGVEYEGEDPRIGADLGEFDHPFGVAVGHGRLYVSEYEGARVQVLTLEGEPLHVFDSPDGKPLGGICTSGEQVWVVGEHDDPNQVHILTIRE